MSQEIFSKTLQRIIGQIRFRPTMLSFQNTTLLARRFEDDFEEWRTEKSDDIALYSPSKSKYLHLTSSSQTYINEQKEDSEELLSYLEGSFTKAVKDFELKEIRRVGFRNTIVLESKFGFSELIDLVFRKFYYNQDKLKSMSANKLVDAVFVLDGESNNFRNHVQIGPMKKPQAIRVYNANFEIDHSAISENNLLIDVDVFSTEKLTGNNATKELKNAVEENFRITKEYLKYLSS